jgi:O-antigen/teichoic acid export membrane protein
VLEGLVKRLREAARSRFARDVAPLAGGGSIAGQALALIQAVLVARWMGPSGYGVAVLVMALPDLIFGLVDFRAAQGTTRYVQEFRARSAPEKVAAMCLVGYLVDLGVAVATTLIALLAAPWLAADALAASGGRALMLAYAGSFAFRALIPTSICVMTVDRRFGTIARVEAASAAVRTAAVLILVLAGLGPAGVVAGNILYGVVRGLLMVSAARRSAQSLAGRGLFSGRLADLAGDLGGIARFLAHNNMASIAAVALKRLDLVLIGAWFGPRTAGLYRVAKNVPSPWDLVGGPLQSVAFERFTGLAPRSEWAALRRLAGRLTAGVGAPGAAVTALGIAALPLAFRLLMGPEYAEAVPYAQLFLAGSLTGIVLFWSQSLHLARGEPGVWAAGNTLRLAVFMALGAALAREMGALGCAVAFLVANAAADCLLAARQWRQLAVRMTA